MTGEQPPKYWAFISYSHRDEQWAAWLHRRMETYRVPKKIVGGRVPPRAYPVFRDRDELSSASDLTDRVVSALGDSSSMIVICSPDAARSRWVNEEIRQFQKLRGTDRIFAFIVSGEPLGGECFPPALTEKRGEPIAADARDVGDGRKNAFLKLMAGVLSIEFDALRRRDYERQLRVRTVWTAVLLVLAAVLAGLAIYAYRQRNVAIERQRVAVSRQLIAESLLQMSTRVDRSLLLAIEAHNVAPTAEARSNLLHLLQSSPTLVTILRGHGAAVTVVNISPDGKTIASGDRDGTLRLWSTDGRPLSEKPIYRHTAEYDALAAVGAIAFSPDGTMVASGSHGGSLRFADVATLTPRFGEDNLSGPINDLEFTPDGKLLLVEHQNLSAFDLKTGKVLEPRFRTDNWRGTVAVSPDGTIVAEAFFNHSEIFPRFPVLYDFSSRRESETFPRQEGGMARSLTFSPDGALLAETTVDGTIRVTNVASREVLCVARGAANIDVLALAFTGNHWLTTVWSDGMVREYAGPALTDIRETLSLGALDAAALAPNHDTIVTGHRDGTIRIHRIAHEHGPLGVGIYSDYLTDVAFTPDGKTLAVAGQSGIALLDVDSRKETRQLGHDHVSSIAITTDGRTLASAALEGVDFWDLRSGKRTHVPSAKKEPYNWRIAVTPDGRLAAFSGHSLTVWDVSAKKVVAKPGTGKGSVYGVAISGDGKLLAASSESGTIHFFELPSVKPTGAPIAFGTEAWALAFTPDDKSLVAGGDDGRMVVYDVKTRRAVGKPIPGHTTRIDNLAFSPDGKLFVSVGFDRTALLIDQPARLPLGNPLFRSEKYGVIRGAAFSPDGKLLALAEQRQRLWFFDVGVDAWIARACRVVNRNLTPEEWVSYLPDEPYRETCTAFLLAR